MIDRVTAKLGRTLYEVPVGFKWFVEGLLDGSLGFGGEESAGASFVRLDGTVWTTDKDGIVPALLSAEMTARMGRDPGEIYRELTREFGEPAYDRVEAPATPDQKELLAKLSPQQVKLTELAGETIQTVLTQAPGNDAPIGGVKVIAESGWFAARPSGTEDIYKIYAESFRGRRSSAPYPGGSPGNRQRCVGGVPAAVRDSVRANAEGKAMNTHRRASHPIYNLLPTEIEGFDSLAELALDLRWSWNHATDRVWRQLDPALWAVTHNPWVVLQTVSRDQIERVLADPPFRKDVDDLIRIRRDTAKAPAWFQHAYPQSPLSCVAYFSMEFMLSEALPIYSGGLGNVAGDHSRPPASWAYLWSAWDCSISQGYFRQVIGTDGDKRRFSRIMTRDNCRSRHGKERWRGTTETWQPAIRHISDAELWQLRTTARNTLIDYARERLSRQLTASGAWPETMKRTTEIFDPNALTLGFARRFATYKRPNLLLHDPAALAAPVDQS